MTPLLPLMKWTTRTAFVFALCVAGPTVRAADGAVTVSGSVVDADSGQVLPARVYIHSSDGAWFFPKSASPEGSAIEYRRQPSSKSVEMHTTLSAHPFTVELPPGRYVFTAEHGKQFLPAEQTITVEQAPVRVELKLKRWIDMAARGWFSGDTHSHRPLAEMPNALLAEDLNIAFPLSHWVALSGASPQSANKVPAPVPPGEVITLDPSHLIYPLNTEYEIVNTNGQPHTLGAFLVIGLQTPLTDGVPPVAPVLAQARREGALIDLEKHSWPWSIAMAAVLKADLFELANNHVWRTEFGFPQWTLSAAGKYMNLEMDERGFTEWGWIDFGFQTYYALLNCGFPIRPTGGTAAGVHPVPLGFGRVYARQPDGFSYEKWMAALKAGHSFVTTGPMLFVRVNEKEPGDTLSLEAATKTVQLTGTVESLAPLERIEIVVNGRVVKGVTPVNTAREEGGFENRLAESVPVDGSGWIAVRAFESNGGRRNRFAHSSPVFIEIPGRPLRPRREEIDYLIQRVEEEIARNENVLSPTALDEYREALKIYRTIGQTAQP
ncbi:MAG: CehA/McbA family metallohydrolase [Chthoniobacteraceae bacterium]